MTNIKKLWAEKEDNMNLLEVLLNQITFFSTLLILGFFVVKINLVTDENITSFAKVLLRVFVPVMVLTIVGSSGTREELFAMGPFFFASFFMFFILMVVAFISAKIAGFRPPLMNVHVCSGMFVNSALLGYPIIIAMFPSESGLAIATFLVVETSILWTVGVMILTYGKGGKGFDFKKMITPMTVALFIALLIILFDLRPSGVVWDTLTGFGASQKYLGLLYIGMDIGRRGFKTLFKNPKVFIVSPVKLIISPILVFLIMRALNILDYNHLIIITVFSMLPSMMIVTMLANEYDTHPEYASAALLSTTVLSLGTMPLVFWLVTSVL